MDVMNDTGYARTYASKSNTGPGDMQDAKLPLPLHAQCPTPAPASIKIKLSILATAIVDALGGPAEFSTRFTFPFVTSMLPNQSFNLPPGVWTDDTSMTLCLARSLATYVPKQGRNDTERTVSNDSDAGNLPPPDSEESLSQPGGFDELDQLNAYARWFEKGELSATGRCFDIGNTTRHALSLYNRYKLRYPKSGQSLIAVDQVLGKIKAELSGEYSGGNGSLMRVLPIGLAWWRSGYEAQAREYAGRSSLTTHPNPVCVEACEVWTGGVTRIMRAAVREDGEEDESIAPKYSKLDLLEYFAGFPYTTGVLRTTLALPPGAPPPPPQDSPKHEREEYYRKYHPILSLIDKTRAEVVPKDNFRWPIPSEETLSSSGYVVHTLVAALYCFLATETFEEGAILAVNLGNDADTVGAIYGGLAGCWYAGPEELRDEGIFWSNKVKEWRSQLVERSLVEEVAEQLAEFSNRQVMT